MSEVPLYSIQLRLCSLTQAKTADIKLGLSIELGGLPQITAFSYSRTQAKTARGQLQILPFFFVVRWCFIYTHISSSSHLTWKLISTCTPTIDGHPALPWKRSAGWPSFSACRDPLYRGA